jgi:hypothetical protein
MDHFIHLEFQELIDELRANYSVFIENRSSFFKGVVSKTCLHNYYEVDPSLFVRESKTKIEHGNVYNLLLNNLPSWGNIPKRQHSVIMSSNYNTAKSFSIPITSKGFIHGKTYCVLPENESILAIASDGDIWNSFKNGLSKIGLRGKNGNLIKFNCILNELYKSTQNNTEFDKNWELLNENLIKLANGIIVPKISLSDEETRMLNYLKNNRNDLIGFFDEIFNPNLNGIMILQFNKDFEMKNYRNNEIWTASKCVFFADDSLEEVKKIV